MGGRDLKIESLQDTAKYDSKSQSVGGSVTFGYGAGGNANYSGSKVNADYAAVGEQAGIRAGDGGFQIQVAGATELIGGAITSSQAAIDAGKNRLTTATLEARDIANRSQFSASAVTVSAGTSGGMAGAYKDSGDDRSTTRSTISAGQTVLSAADEASRAVLEGLDRGATNDATTGKLAQGWDGQKLQQQSRLNAQIVADFGAEASQRVGSLAETKMVQAEKLKLEAEKLPEGPERDAKLAEAESLRAAWDVDGSARVALHATIGALTGDVAGMLGGASSPIVAARVAEYLEQTGADAETSKLVMSIASTVVGGVLGGAEGSAAAFNEVRNNATSLSPFASVRSAVRSVTAALENQCGGNCTEAQYREIDAKARQVEFAATMAHVVALGGEISQEDAQKTAQIVMELAPVYGTVEAVLQVLTGKETLTGEEVSRYAAALGAIPIVGPVLKRAKVGAELAQKAAEGVHAALAAGDTAAAASKLKELDSLIGAGQIDPQRLAQRLDALGDMSDITKVVVAEPGRKGEWGGVLGGSLDSNTAYVSTNGQIFVADGAGRVSTVSADLSTVRLDRNTSAQNSAGKSGLPGDEGGHFIATALGGIGDAINLEAQARSLNRGPWRSMEAELLRELRSGSAVSIKIDVGYSVDAARPESYRVVAFINGKSRDWEFSQ